MTKALLAALGLALGASCGSNGPPGADTGASDETMLSTTQFNSALVCAECHERQYAEWRQSMHAYAARSPVFDVMVARTLRDTAGEVGTFCTGCHSQIGLAQGEAATVTAEFRSKISSEGVSCEVCHSAVTMSGPIGNARLEHRPGFEGGPFDTQDAPHDAGDSAFVTSPELCGACHDVYMYPGLQVEEAYTEYVLSPARADQVRCQDCHMSSNPGVVAEREWGPAVSLTDKVYPVRELSSHRFVGPDYSLIDDFPYRDDLDASAVAQREYLGQVATLLANAVRLDDVSAGFVDGALVIEVDVESLTAGHRVPTGFTSERQLWLDVTVTDPLGEVVFASGDLDSYGDLRDSLSWDVAAGAVERDEQLVNYQSENIYFTREYTAAGTFEVNGTEAGASSKEHTVFPFDANDIRKNSLEPLEVRHHTYLVDVPADVYDIDVALRYRNLPPYLLRALGIADHVDRLVTFTIDRASIEVR